MWVNLAFSAKTASPRCAQIKREGKGKVCQCSAKSCPKSWFSSTRPRAKVTFATRSVQRLRQYNNVTLNKDINVCCWTNYIHWHCYTKVPQYVCPCKIANALVFTAHCDLVSLAPVLSLLFNQHFIQIKLPLLLIFKPVWNSRRKSIGIIEGRVWRLPESMLTTVQAC